MNVSPLGQDDTDFLSHPKEWIEAVQAGASDVSQTYFFSAQPQLGRCRRGGLGRRVPSATHGNVR
jgi:hypothetical protein